jgi:hypothetical protein
MEAFCPMNCSDSNAGQPTGWYRATPRWILLTAVALTLLAGAMASSALAANLNFSPGGAPVVQADWQGPSSLPPRFRNHCSVDPLSGRIYCSNHCGLDHQFYYCTEASFGCCHLGRGYCGWNGVLRCAP